jgi:hypothetical protein
VEDWYYFSDPIHTASPPVCFDFVEAETQLWKLTAERTTTLSAGTKSWHRQDFVLSRQALDYVDADRQMQRLSGKNQNSTFFV